MPVYQIGQSRSAGRASPDEKLNNIYGVAQPGYNGGHPALRLHNKHKQPIGALNRRPQQSLPLKYNNNSKKESPRFLPKPRPAAEVAPRQSSLVRSASLVLQRDLGHAIVEPVAERSAASNRLEAAMHALSDQDEVGSSSFAFQRDYAQGSTLRDLAAGQQDIQRKLCLLQNGVDECTIAKLEEDDVQDTDNDGERGDSPSWYNSPISELQGRVAEQLESRDFTIMELQEQVGELGTQLADRDCKISELVAEGDRKIAELVAEGAECRADLESRDVLIAELRSEVQVAQDEAEMCKLQVLLEEAQQTRRRSDADSRDALIAQLQCQVQAAQDDTGMRSVHAADQSRTDDHPLSEAALLEEAQHRSELESRDAIIAQLRLQVQEAQDEAVMNSLQATSKRREADRSSETAFREEAAHLAALDHTINKLLSDVGCRDALILELQEQVKGAQEEAKLIQRNLETSDQEGQELRGREVALAERLAVAMEMVAAAEQRAAEMQVQGAALEATEMHSAVRELDWGLERVTENEASSPLGRAATWHPHDFASRRSRRPFHRCAANPATTTDTLCLSDSSWPSSSPSRSRTFSWMSRTGTDRCFDSIHECYDGTDGELNFTNGGVAAFPRDPLVAGLIRDAIDDHLHACTVDALQESVRRRQLARTEKQPMTPPRRVQHRVLSGGSLVSTVSVPESSDALQESAERQQFSAIERPLDPHALSKAQPKVPRRVLPGASLASTGGSFFEDAGEWKHGDV